VDRNAHQLARPIVAKPTAASWRVAVIGGGWAGLAAAVEAAQRGHVVTVFEMAPQLGGRARRVEVDGFPLDNGQHILIGAYVKTLTLMGTVGVDVSSALLRTPLRITYPDGVGLQLNDGSPTFAFATAVMRHKRWVLRDRIALLRAAAAWSLRGFRCAPMLTVATLTAGLPASVREELIDPLCVAALNTSSSEASAAVFLRVLKDALFSGAGSADLLLPRVDLSRLFPDAALAWLERAGAGIRLHHRVNSLTMRGQEWWVDDIPFDRVVLATTPNEAARLAAPIAPEWSAIASRLHYEPIATVYLRIEGVRLASPMLALHADAASPAQFVFDRGQLGGPEGLLAFVISGAQSWVDKGMLEIVEATLRQCRQALGASVGALTEAHVLRTLIEKRATFKCIPGLMRAPMSIAPGLHAAGDHVEGPYPATLEGAVRSGIDAVSAFD
jgi:squalene-associated FAD-dependent desaturase